MPTVTTRVTSHFCSLFTTRMVTSLKSLDFIATTAVTAMPCTVAAATVPHLAAVTTCTSEVTPTTTPAHTLTWDTPTTLPTAVQLPVDPAAPCWPEVIDRLQCQISKCSMKPLRSKTLVQQKIIHKLEPTQCLGSQLE